MTARRLVLAGLAAGIALAAAGCGGSDPEEAALAIVSSREDVYTIFLMGAEGEDQRPLTEERPDETTGNDVYFELDPAWSPDGGRIAFSSKRGGSFDIYVVNADGTGLTRLTQANVDESQPTWSPDGSRIAYQRGPVGDVYVMNADGTAPRRLTPSPSAEIAPAWSPDGRWIAYQQRVPGTPNGELWLVRPDGTGRRQVTRLGAGSYEPAWSPDSARLVFASNDRGSFDLFTIGVDGTGLEQLTDSVEDEFEPAWSPDGARIAFTRDGAIVSVDREGGDERELTDPDQNDGSPDWRPRIPADDQ